MKKYILLLSALLILPACNPEKYSKGNDGEENQPVEAAQFVKGADISWVTEMEDKGYLFYDNKGKATECTALMKELGMNAIRLRVWVNPLDDPRNGGRSYNDAADVLKKALRVKALGMKLMIDFHYSDYWADPGKQTIPAAWKNLDTDAMAKALAAHTAEVLELLKTNGVDVDWVQVGNEVTSGMLWETGMVKGQEASSFCKLFTAGRDAVKSVFPDAEVILHVDNSWKMETLSWFFDLMSSKKLNYDVIGLSLYPSYWQEGGYPDWREKTVAAVDNFQALHAKYGKPVFLVEFGMPAAKPVESKESLQFLMDKTAAFSWFKGIMLWEPESEKSRNAYEYGAFSNGTATIALDPFKN
ncbi:MAG: arabinogalactan endo-1,4-beta-galactosidase [Bacteroidales bacterium]|nr:arabinogalactan endo-1,4-beta-galactosidase [Bacteroidales bacterium]